MTNGILGRDLKAEKLTKEQELELIEKAKQGDIQSRNRLIEANLPFMIYSASIYFKTHKYPKDVDREDLIQMCVLGMIRAIEKYDLNKKVKLICYAKHWFRHYMDREREFGQSIHIPNWVRYHQKRGTIKNQKIKERIDSYQDPVSIRLDQCNSHTYESDPYDRMIHIERLHLLNDAIERLPKKHKQIFKKVKFEGYTVRALATKTRSRQTVQNIIKECLKVISDKMISA